MELSINSIKVFADGLDHPESVAYHPDGTLWAGGEAGQLYRISHGGKKVDEVAQTGGFILGIAFSPRADWLAVCDSGKKCVWKLDLVSYELKVFAKAAEEHQFNIPNYACFDRQGNLYVSESGASGQVRGKILKFNREGVGKIWCEGPFNFANGIALDEKQAFVYVVCSFLPGVERIRINADGSAGAREVVVILPESVPDGLAFDATGNLYVSCYAPNKIYRVKPDRTVSVFASDWQAHGLSNPTNIAFGGANFDQLFIANLGRWHISQIDAGTRGLKLACH